MGDNSEEVALVFTHEEFEEAYPEAKDFTSHDVNLAGNSLDILVGFKTFLDTLDISGPGPWRALEELALSAFRAGRSGP